MTEAYGHRWTSTNGEDPRGSAGQTWANGLYGFTPHQIAKGLESTLLRLDGWPPVLSQFRAMCLGIPDFVEVNRELMGDDSHGRTGFARLVWSFVDGYAHRHAAAREAERMRREAYGLACDHVMRGGALPTEPAGALEKPQCKPKDIPSTREERVENLRRLLGAEFNPEAAAKSDRA